jgi:hypothetical protein
MTEINAFGGTYRGTAEGDHGVFTHRDGHVYAGQIAGDSACVGVFTWTDGDTWFVECDADGKEHGRWLYCIAGGNTWYIRYEHGSRKEHAVLRANGTCEYDGKACRADYAPFVALRAMVVPIKARPPLVPHSRLSLCRIFSPPPPASRSNPPLFLALAGVGDDPRRQGAHLPPPPVACTARASHSSGQTNAPRVRPGRRSVRKGALRMRHTTTCVVHPFRRPVPAVQRSGPSCASAFIITCRTPSWSVAGCGGLHMSVLHPTHRAHAANARRRRVSHRAPALRPHRTDQI